VQDEEAWRIEVYRERLKRSIPARFFQRFHVSLILAGSIFAGWAVDVLLLQSGLRPMLLRFPLAILCAYCAFIGGARLWLDYSGIDEYLKRTKAAELTGDEEPASRPPPIAESRRHGNVLDFLELGSLDEGCLVAVGVALLVGIVFFTFGGYAVMAAEAIFADVVVELLLAAGLLRGVRRVERGGWLGGLWSNTWPSLAFTLALAIAAGFVAQKVAPSASTLGELWTALHAPGAIR
jgi:hypothetical protein